jgi:putative membrane protein
MWHIGDGMAWWMVFGTLFEIVVVVAVVVLIANYVGTPRTDRSPPSENPLEIVKRRYANGEITREEFDQLRRDLTDPDLNGART